MHLYSVGVLTRAKLGKLVLHLAAALSGRAVPRLKLNPDVAREIDTSCTTAARRSAESLR